MEKPQVSTTNLLRFKKYWIQTLKKILTHGRAWLSLQGHDSDSPFLFLPRLKARLSPFLQKGATFSAPPVNWAFKKPHLNRRATKKAFLDVFQHLYVMTFDSFMSTRMMCVTTEEDTARVTETTGLTGPPGTCYPTCHAELHCVRARAWRSLTPEPIFLAIP